MKQINIIKIIIISIVAIITLLSIGKNLNLTTNNNLLVKFINNVFGSEENTEKNISEPSTKVANKNADNLVSSRNEEDKNRASSSQNSNNEEKRMFEEISRGWYGTKVITQNDNIISLQSITHQLQKN